MTENQLTDLLDDLEVNRGSLREALPELPVAMIVTTAALIQAVEDAIAAVREEIMRRRHARLERISREAQERAAEALDKFVAATPLEGVES